MEGEWVGAAFLVVTTPIFAFAAFRGADTTLLLLPAERSRGAGGRETAGLSFSLSGSSSAAALPLSMSSAISPSSSSSSSEASSAAVAVARMGARLLCFCFTACITFAPPSCTSLLTWDEGVAEEGVRSLAADGKALLPPSGTAAAVAGPRVFFLSRTAVNGSQSPSSASSSSSSALAASR